MKKNLLACAALSALLSVTALFAEETPVKSLHSYVLDNGLSVFVAENHSVPLAYIEIAVRCGAYTQTPENVGVFHLYEHMMFKGNSLYKDAAAVVRATSDMGAYGRNGTTDIETVNYFFTVPSALTEQGLRFWSAAVRTPTLDKKEFENEKKVVIAEINGQASDPGYRSLKEKYRLFFADSPWTTDPAGTEASIKAATVKQLKEIQKKYYIPNNAALFVGGDVNPDEVRDMAERIFGSWKRGKAPFADGTVRHPAAPFDAPVLRVMPYDKLSPELADIHVEFRGPDAAHNEADTYAADILSSLIAEPSGLFKRTLSEDPLLGLPDADYTSGGYHTRRTCGLFSFSAMVVSPEQDIAERALYFAEKLPLLMQSVSSAADSESLAALCRRLEDDAVIQRQTAKGLLSSLRFWWAVTGEDYYYTYNQNMAKVDSAVLSAFCRAYFDGKNPLVTLYVHPSVYEKTKEQFSARGFFVSGGVQ